jgi:hypothetical protein
MGCKYSSISAVTYVDYKISTDRESEARTAYIDYQNHHGAAHREMEGSVVWTVEDSGWLCSSGSFTTGFWPTA